MIHFPDQKELWRTRRLSWQKAESVGGLRLLETGGVSRGCNGHDAAFPSGEVFVSFCPVCKSETSLLPAPSCPGSLLLSVFSQWSHAPVSFLCLYVLGVKHRAPKGSRGTAPHPPRHHLLPAWLSGHTFAEGRLLFAVVWTLQSEGAGLKCCNDESQRCLWLTHCHSGHAQAWGHGWYKTWPKFSWFL